MNRRWETTILGWVLSGVIYAQVCTPDTAITGIEPDTLPDAVVGDYYDEVIYFKIPLTRTIFTQTITVDSAHIDSIAHFPSSFMYQCNKPSCMYVGGEYGCIRITGSPTVKDTGTRNVVVFVTVYTYINNSVVTLPQIDSLPFTVLDTGTATSTGGSLEEITELDYYVGPNPFDRILYLQVPDLEQGKVKVAIYDLLGKPVMQYRVYHPGGRFVWKWYPISLRDGLYVLQLRTSGRTLTTRIHRRGK